MILTIVAVLLLFISTIAALLNKFKYRSPFSCKLFDRTNYWPNKIVEAEVESVTYTNGNYQVVCQTLGKKQNIQMPADNHMIQTLNEHEVIYLIQYQFPKGYVFAYAPIENMASKLKISENDADHSVDQMKELEEKAKKLHTLNLIMYGTAILLSMQFSLTSIFLSVFSIIMFFNVIPCGQWTKAKNVGIIKSLDKKNKSQGNDSEIQKNLPVGFDTWTDNQKELYDIQKRLSITIENQPSTNENQDEGSFSVPIQIEDKTENSTAGNEDQNTEDQEASLPEIVPRCCKKCGGIVNETATFCEHCGAKLDDDGSEDDDVEDQVTTEEEPQITLDMGPEIDGLDDFDDIMEAASDSDEQAPQKSQVKKRSAKKNHAVEDEYSDIIDDSLF